MSTAIDLEYLDIVHDTSPPAFGPVAAAMDNRKHRPALHQMRDNGYLAEALVSLDLA